MRSFTNLFEEQKLKKPPKSWITKIQKIKEKMKVAETRPKLYHSDFGHPLPHLRGFWYWPQYALWRITERFREWKANAKSTQPSE